jgi:hypothetical protein
MGTAMKHALLAAVVFGLWAGALWPNRVGEQVPSPRLGVRQVTQQGTMRKQAHLLPNTPATVDILASRGAERIVARYDSSLGAWVSYTDDGHSVHVLRGVPQNLVRVRPHHAMFSGDCAYDGHPARYALVVDDGATQLQAGTQVTPTPSFTLEVIDYSDALHPKLLLERPTTGAPVRCEQGGVDVIQP